MKKRYLFFSSLLLIAGIILAFLPEKHHTNELKPEELLLEVIGTSRFISTDEVAKMLIDKDPSVQLIDLRSAEEYKKWSLPNAINIPLEKVLDENSKATLSQEGKRNVFFANGTIYANQAWILLRRLTFRNNYVLKGGLNAWVETIMQPVAPPITADRSEFIKYKFRRAASMFFGGGNATISAPETQAKPTDIKPVVKKEKKAGGGC